MSFIITPTTASPGTTITASGRAAKRASSRIRLDGVLLLSFTTSPSGTFTQTFKVPSSPDKTSLVVFQQLRSDGVWAQAASANLVIKNTVKPIAPASLQVILGDKKITLNWGYVNLATTYNIYRNNVLIGTSAIPSYTDTSGLVDGQTYTYQVSATNASGEGPKSIAISATPIAVPAAPTNLTATAGDKIVTLGWQ